MSIRLTTPAEEAEFAAAQERAAAKRRATRARLARERAEAKERAASPVADGLRRQADGLRGQAKDADAAEAEGLRASAKARDEAADLEDAAEGRPTFDGIMGRLGAYGGFDDEAL